MKPFLITALIVLLSPNAFTQNNDSLVLRNIFTYALEQGKAYERLDYLSNKIGARLSGSEGAEKAVLWARSVMEEEENGNVMLQDVMVPHWIRNDKEQLTAVADGRKIPLTICSLGGSVPTPAGGLRAKVIEVKSFEELEQLGEKKIKGKIVFFNVPMSQHHIMTFHAYGETGKYRYSGAINAAKFGAVASINRSLTLSLDDIPHTGAMGYNDTITKIPGCAISTLGAEQLSALLKKDPDTELILEMNCETRPDILSHNVIAEIKGTEFPEEIILVGGHLDCWDKGVGAHDDGAGCVQSMELLRIFRDLKIKPKRTIRVVLFMNEENGLKGAAKYAEVSDQNNETHIAAIESDAGGFTPHGFMMKCKDTLKYSAINKWKELFVPYGLHVWDIGWGGADINKLENQNTLLFGLLPDTQRYFDYHHADSDTFDKVNRRELLLGAATMTSLVYLLSEYGVIAEHH